MRTWLAWCHASQRGIKLPFARTWLVCLFVCLVVSCFTLFSKLFHLFHGGQCTYVHFHGVLSPLLHASYWLLFHITSVDTITVLAEVRTEQKKYFSI